MDIKVVHVLVKRHQRTDNGANYGFETVPNIGCLMPDSKIEPFMAPSTENLLAQPTGIDGPLHDKTFEPLIRPAEDVTDVCD